MLQNYSCKSERLNEYNIQCVFGSMNQNVPSNKKQFFVTVLPKYFIT